MRWLMAAALALGLAACSGDDTGTSSTTTVEPSTTTTGPSTTDTRSVTTASPDDEAAWLDQYGPFTSVVTEQGQKVGLMEDDGTLYTYDCDLADQLTAEGAKYGPSARDPQTGDYTPGYGTVCGSR